MVGNTAQQLRRVSNPLGISALGSFVPLRFKMDRRDFLGLSMRGGYAGQVSALKIEYPSMRGGRVLVLDELKGLAIILVVLYHAGGVLLWRNVASLDLGVDIFVILSGMGLAMSSRVEGAGEFLRRRLVRIMPAYWVVLTAYLILNTHFLQIHYSIPNVLLHYTGMHGWAGDAIALAINDSFWFITLILSLYIFYAWARRWNERLDLLLLAGGVFSAVAAVTLFYTGQSGSYGHIALRLPGFFLGILLGKLAKTGRLELAVGAPLALALLLFTYVTYVQGIVFFNVAVAFGLMLAYIFLGKSLLFGAAAPTVGRDLRYFGDRSLEIFLIHQPLIREYNYYLHGRWLHDGNPSATSLIIGMAIGMGVTLILSGWLRRFSEAIHGLLIAKVRRS